VPGHLNFDAASPATALLGSGWNLPERAGVWSQLRRASLFMVSTESGRPLAMTVAGDVFVAPGHERVELTLLVDGAVALTRTVTYPDSKITLCLVVSPIAGRGAIEIDFDVNAPASPLRVNSGQDRRMLGIFLRSVDLAYADETGCPS
jgi:hypothetical protein